MNKKTIYIFVGFIIGLGIGVISFYYVLQHRYLILIKIGLIHNPTKIPLEKEQQLPNFK